MGVVVGLVVAARGGLVVGALGTETVATVATVVGDGLATGVGAAGLVATFGAGGALGTVPCTTDGDASSAGGSATTVDTSPTNGWSSGTTSTANAVSEGDAGVITAGAVEAVEAVDSDDEVMTTDGDESADVLEANGRPTPRTPGTPMNDATMANAKRAAMLPTPRATQVTAFRRPPWLVTKIGRRPELTLEVSPQSRITLQKGYNRRDRTTVRPCRRTDLGR